MNNLFIIIGKSCTGKTTIINKITKKNDDVKKLVLNTTRPKRKGEIDGIDYVFSTPKELRANDWEYPWIDGPLYYEKYRTIYGIWEYYIKAREFNNQLDPSKITIMNGIGRPKNVFKFIKKAKENLAIDNPYIIYIKSSWYVRLYRSFKRLKKQGITIKGILEIIRRLLSEFKDYYRLEQFINKRYDEYNINIIKNNNINSICKLIKNDINNNLDDTYKFIKNNINNNLGKED